MALPVREAGHVGANVGLFTLPLAKAVRPGGKVLAIEPLSPTVERLRENLALNQAGNVDICTKAAGDAEGQITLLLSTDPAFHSTVTVAEGLSTQLHVTVPIARVDRIWEEAGSPAVSVMKVDVEGAELAVLQGSEMVLERWRPALLLEATTDERLRDLTAVLSRYGYVRRQPKGFMPWNHLFVPAEREPHFSTAEEDGS